MENVRLCAQGSGNSALNFGNSVIALSAVVAEASRSMYLKIIHQLYFTFFKAKGVSLSPKNDQNCVFVYIFLRQNDNYLGSVIKRTKLSHFPPEKVG